MCRGKFLIMKIVARGKTKAHLMNTCCLMVTCKIGSNVISWGPTKNSRDFKERFKNSMFFYNIFFYYKWYENTRLLKLLYCKLLILGFST